MILERDFYARDTVTVARELLGKRLVCLRNGERVSGVITETEAYLGMGDTACHAHKGHTARTEIMFGEAGHAYVYLCYGLHNMLNIVTREAGEPEAVLIRALHPQENMDIMRVSRGTGGDDRNLANGPGKLCQALGVTKKRHHGLDLTLGAKLWLEPCAAVNPAKIFATPRIGINYAAPADVSAPLRFVWRLA